MNARARREAAYGVGVISIALIVLVIVVGYARGYYSAVVADRPLVFSAYPPLTSARTVVEDRLTLAPRESASSHAIGSVDEANPIDSRRLHVRGWIVTSDLKIASRVIAVIDGTEAYEVTREYGTSRPDVAISLARPDLANVGIDAMLSTSGLSDIPHAVTFATVSTSNTAEFLARKRKFFLYGSKIRDGVTR